MNNLKNKLATFVAYDGRNVISAVSFLEKSNKYVVQIYTFILLTVYLWFSGQYGYNSIGTAKDDLFFIIHYCFIGCMLLLQLVYLIINQHIDHDLMYIFKTCRVSVVLVFLYLLLVWLSDLQSPHWPVIFNNQGVFNECTLSMTIYCVCFVFLLSYLSLTSKIVYIFGASVSLYCVVCQLQVEGLNPLGLYRDGGMYNLQDGLYWQGQFLGTLGNSDFTSGFLAPCAILFLGIVVRGTSRYRFLAIVPLVLSAVTLVRTRVYIGLVGLVGGLVSFFIVALVRSNRWRRNILILMLCATLLLLLAIYNVNIPESDNGSSYNLLYEIQQILHGNIEDSMGSSRVGIWRQVLDRIPERLIQGHGSETMRWGDFDMFSRYSVEQGVLLHSIPNAAHNVYLEILYSYGILTLFVFCFLLLYTLYWWVKLSVFDDSVAIVGAGLCSWCIQAFFNINTSITSPYFWLLLSLELRLVYSERKNLIKQ